MAYGQTDPRSRATGLALAVLVQAAIGWALLNGLAVRFSPAVQESLAVFGVAPPAPPPPPVIPKPPPEKVKAPEGAAAPPNLRSRATEVAAPEPIVIVPRPPPLIVVAAKPADGGNRTSGAAERPGPGTGAGGEGDGFGSGRGGRGGGTGLEPRPPVQIAGRITPKDWPGQVSGTVELRYFVETNGRVSDCVIIHTSGSPLLDETTCRLIETRFRFRPATDEDGRPEAVWVRSIQEWQLDRMVAE